MFNSPMLRDMARTSGSSAQTTAPRIQAAALRLFAQNGYAAVSMRQIAAEVGLQAGALYRYTPDKQSLLADLMRGHLEHLLQAWANADPGGAATDRLQAFVRFHVTYHLARPDEVFIAYMELRNLSADNFSAVEDLRRLYETELEQILHQGACANLFEVAPVRITTMAIIAMLTGVTTWFREDGGLSRHEVADLYASKVLAMVHRPAT